MKACLMRILYQPSPLLDGEECVSERVTYLIAQTGFFPAGTVTVELTTNRAILYYVISSARLNGRGGLLIAPGTGTNLQTEVIQTLAASDTFQDTSTATGAKIVEDLTKQYLVEAGTSIAAQAVLGSISGGLATLVLGG